MGCPSAFAAPANNQFLAGWAKVENRDPGSQSISNLASATAPAGHKTMRFLPDMLYLGSEPAAD